MMRQRQRSFSLEGADGKAVCQVHAIVSYRSAEETKEDDLLRATETSLVLIPSRDVPTGGIVRGMKLTRGGAQYRVLVPVEIGRYWRLKCERVWTETEALG